MVEYDCQWFKDVVHGVCVKKSSYWQLHLHDRDQHLATVRSDRDIRGHTVRCAREPDRRIEDPARARQGRALL